LFAGYNRYTWGEQLWSRVSRVPKPLRLCGGRILKMAPDRLWSMLEHLPGAPRQLGLKAGKFADVMALDDPNALYRRLVSCWDSRELCGISVEDGPLWDASLNNDLGSVVERMQYLDSVTYLPDDILTKVDRASMAVSLEARVPLLDHRVAEFAFMLPQNLRRQGSNGKIVLKNVLERYVPRSLFERPKMGFGIPIGQWLRGPLRDWAETLLAERALEDSGLTAAPIRRVWGEHLSGRQSFDTHLWTILMYQAWFARWAAA